MWERRDPESSINQSRGETAPMRAQKVEIRGPVRQEGALLYKPSQLEAAMFYKLACPQVTHCLTDPKSVLCLTSEAAGT